jgi:uncharacterized damage-inducible protein DinB
MSIKTEMLADIDATRAFFDRSTSLLAEADSGFKATPESMTPALQVAHVAQTIDWFREGGYEGKWRMDFEAMFTEIVPVTSLTKARSMLAAAWDRLRAATEALTEAQLLETLPDNPILPGRARYHVISGLVDHCAHHRGALALCTRLLGRVPPMPYAG